MLIKAHHRSGNRIAGRFGRLAAVSVLCVLSIVLALCAQASASAPATATLGAVAQATTQQLSSTAGTTVEQVAAATLARPSPSAPDQPAPADARAAASAQQAAPAGSHPAPAGSHAAPAQPAAPAGAAATAAPSRPPAEARNAAVAGVGQQTSGQIATASGVSRGSASTAIRTIVGAATAGGGGSPRTTPVTGVVQGLRSSRAGDVVRTLSRTVADATGSSRVVQTLVNDASTLTGTSTLIATVAQGTRLLDAIEQLTSSVAGPALATLQTIAQVLVARPPAASQGLAAPSPLGSGSPLASLSALAAASPLAASSQLAAALPPASALKSGAGWPLDPPTAFAQSGLGGGSAWAAAPGIRARAPADFAGALPLAPILPGGQSAASPPAQGAHRAPLPASPASTPSPGGVSPAAAVGVGAGLSIGLALAALLMLAAPPALRRLRLDGESWRLAPLQLIAERPG
jgi:hypothetical protein